MINNMRTNISLMGVLIGAALGTAMPGLYAQTPAAPSNNAAAAPYPPPVSGCPTVNFAATLSQYMQPAAKPPTQAPQSFCDFHQSTYQAYVWATTMINGKPRFLSLKTLDQLTTKNAAKKNATGLMLNLASRQHFASATHTEGAGAIVQADGNMLVDQNGYPVYASVHMNQSYFDTAQKNLIVTGQYQNNPSPTDNFAVGAAVFKATWLRVPAGKAPPAGAYTTQAMVPVLAVSTVNGQQIVSPDGNKTVQVTIALVGLHVVNLTDEHPEFLWGTFEHHLNAPMVPDGQFNPNNKSAQGYTFYKANTPFSEVNVPNQNGPTGATVSPLVFNVANQTFSPIVNVVQDNATGGEQGGGANITSINNAGKAFLNSKKSPFANYDMIGTVWFKPNAYSGATGLTLNQNNAVGSIHLANSTAETFVQYPQNTNNLLNCFACHNASSFQFVSGQKPLASRLIASSHALAQGSPYAVPNQVVLPTPPATPKP